MISFSVWLKNNFNNDKEIYRPKNNFKFGNIYFIITDIYTLDILRQIYENEIIYRKRKNNKRCYFYNWFCS